ncbi:aminoacyl-tRNA hydrolase [Candidatus Campbellbacteria bacterium]|nr:aminoacyl-tRNA hydrolase [Candidatus Campbellbacteria bacterium]|tara:strand:- start:135 stop:686 length:552 start_codon:yes stop_codon:yes gene_type:complete
MKYIIGLGNPGEKYALNIHNVAWIILDSLFPEGWTFHKYMNAEVKTGHDGLYIKPQTFMNKSGEVISFLKKEEKLNPEQVLVIYDDVDLPLGQIRISYDRGDGGHNGVKSITEHLGSKKSIRIRIGVSRLLEDGRMIKPNVLSNFASKERQFIADTVTPQVERIIKSLTSDGLEKTMNIHNTK